MDTQYHPQETPLSKKPASTRPVPARHGVLGMCQVCLKSAANHWDTAGRFIGCLDAAPGTEFVLVPLDGEGKPEPLILGGTRGSKRYRYFVAEKPPFQPPCWPKALPIYAAIKAAGSKGILASEIEAQGFKHGSVSGYIRKLREHGYISVMDDTDWQTWHIAQAAPRDSDGH